MSLFYGYEDLKRYMNDKFLDKDTGGLMKAGINMGSHNLFGLQGKPKFNSSAITQEYVNGQYTKHFDSMYSMGGTLGDIYRPRTPASGWINPLFLLDHPPTSLACITLKAFSIDGDNRGGLAASDSVSMHMLYLLNDNTQGTRNLMVLMDSNYTKISMNDGQGPVHGYRLGMLR